MATFARTHFTPSQPNSIFSNPSVVPGPSELLLSLPNSVQVKYGDGAIWYNCSDSSTPLIERPPVADGDPASAVVNILGERLSASSSTVQVQQTLQEQQSPGTAPGETTSATDGSFVFPAGWTMGRDEAGDAYFVEASSGSACWARIQHKPCRLAQPALSPLDHLAGPCTTFPAHSQLLFVAIPYQDTAVFYNCADPSQPPYERPPVDNTASALVNVAGERLG